MEATLKSKALEWEQLQIAIDTGRPNEFEAGKSEIYGRCSEELAPFVEREQKLTAILEAADKEYMDDSVPKSDFAENLLDKIAEVVKFERHMNASWRVR
jgi:hypothetical protein